MYTTKDGLASNNVNVVGKVESRWHCPVKSMAGESLPQAFLGFAGLFSDCLYALRDTAAPKAALSHLARAGDRDNFTVRVRTAP